MNKDELRYELSMNYAGLRRKDNMTERQRDRKTVRVRIPSESHVNCFNNMLQNSNRVIKTVSQ